MCELTSFRHLFVIQHEFRFCFFDHFYSQFKFLLDVPPSSENKDYKSQGSLYWHTWEAIRQGRRYLRAETVMQNHPRRAWLMINA